MKIILFFSFLCISITMIKAQQNTDLALVVKNKDTSDVKMISNIIEQWKDNYNNGHAENVAALYDENAYYLTQHFISGIIYGRPAIQAYIQRGVDVKYQIDSIKIKSMDISGDMAYVITRYDAANGGEKVFGVNLVVLRLIGGKWFIVAHEAAVPDAKTAIRELNIKSLH